MWPCPRRAGWRSAPARLYIGDGAAVRKVSPGSDELTTPAGTGSAGPLGDGGLAVRAALANACGATVDHAGNLVIADAGNDRVRVAAASSGTFYGQAMTAGHIYTVAGDGTFGFSGDGGPATAAELDAPAGVAVDGAGNLVIADMENERVRVVAVQTGTFYGRAMTAGDIYTVAGDGTFGFSGDGGPATSAELNLPEGVAVDGAGNLVIADIGQRAGPGGGRPDRHLLRAGDDRRGHLHRRRRRHRRATPATAARPPAPNSTSRRAWRWTARATC